MTIRRVRPRLDTTVDADVVLVGGGVAGLVACLDLVRAGRDVVLLEAATIGSPRWDYTPTGLPRGTYRDAIDHLGADVARSVWETSRDGHRLLLELSRELGVDSGDRGAGGFVLARSRAEGVSLAESEDALRDDGFAGEFLDNYMLSARFDIEGPAAALWVADDASLDTGVIAARLATECEGRGARLFEGTIVVGLDEVDDAILAWTEHGRVRAARTIVTGDAACRRLQPSVGLRSTVEPRATLRTDVGSLRLPTPARTVDGRVCWRVADAALDATAVAGEDLAALLRSWIPLLGSCPVSPTAGERWVTSDHLPLVGSPSAGGRVQVVCGDDLMGPGMAALAGRWAAAESVGIRAAVPATFRLGR